MKHATVIAVIFCCTAANALAQKESRSLPYNNEKLDSLFRAFPKLNQPFVLPVPKNYGVPYANQNGISSFENSNPGAVLINKTSRGIIYSMPTDNMAVLVPALNAVERMPGSGENKMAPGSNMPNPFYSNPGNPKKRK